jgi:hypothetical protein
MESCGFPGLKGDTFGVRFCGGRAGADWLSWYPTLATKTNTWQGWGTGLLWEGRLGRLAFVVSNPCHKKQKRGKDGAPDLLLMDSA